jgi:hypothetical protein
VRSLVVLLALGFCSCAARPAPVVTPPPEAAPIAPVATDAPAAPPTAPSVVHAGRLLIPPINVWIDVEVAGGEPRHLHACQLLLGDLHARFPTGIPREMTACAPTPLAALPAEPGSFVLVQRQALADASWSFEGVARGVAARDDGPVPGVTTTFERLTSAADCEKKLDGALARSQETPAARDARLRTWLAAERTRQEQRRDQACPLVAGRAKEAASSPADARGKQARSNYQRAEDNCSGATRLLELIAQREQAPEVVPAIALTAECRAE